MPAPSDTLSDQPQWQTRNSVPASFKNHHDSFFNISVVFTNIHSVIPKRDELESFIDDTTADMILLTETWLNKDVGDHEVFLSYPNLTVYRRDRHDRREGGVLIAIKDSLPSSLINHDDNIELTWVSMHSTIGKIVFGICYRPPNSNPSFCNFLRLSFEQIKKICPLHLSSFLQTLVIPASIGHYFQYPTEHPVVNPNSFLN